MSLKDFFSDIDSSSSVEYWDHEHSKGFTISWSEFKRGFGEYSFIIDKQNGKFKIDNESDSRKAIKKVIDRLCNDNPEEIRNIIHFFVDSGELLDK
jgi:hypothetical protein